jgi:hypothetical protein
MDEDITSFGVDVASRENGGSPPNVRLATMAAVLNPLSWVPFHGDKRSRRAALLGGALVASLGFHVGLPLADWHSVEAVSDVPITIELMPPPPMPLPEADELVPVPNEEAVELPPKEDVPASDM